MLSLFLSFTIAFLVVAICMGVLALCFYCCRKLCPNGINPKSVNFDDDVVFSNIRQVELAVDERANLLGVCLYIHI